MRNLEDKKLEQLLQTYFSQKAEEINPPPRDEMWEKLEQQLEDKGIFLDAQEGETGEDERSRRGNKWLTLFSGRNSRTAAVLAAACLVMVIALTQVPLTQGLRHLLTGAYLSGDEAPMELQMDMRDDLEKYPTPAAPPERPFIESTVEMEMEEEPEMEEERAIIMSVPDFHEVTYTEQIDFLDALENVKPLAPDKIFRLEPFSRDFVFSEGTIIHSEDLVTLAQWKYVNSAGDSLSVAQHFFENEGAPFTPEFHQPVQVNSYPGQFEEQPDGLNTLLWVQENSLVSLSSKLEEEILVELAEISLGRLE